MTCVRMLELGPRAFYFLVVSVCLSIVRVPLFMLILIVIDIGPRNRLLGWLAPRAASRAPGAVARRPRASAPK